MSSTSVVPTPNDSVVKSRFWTYSNVRIGGLKCLLIPTLASVLSSPNVLLLTLASMSFSSNISLPTSMLGLSLGTSVSTHGSAFSSLSEHRKPLSVISQFMTYPNQCSTPKFPRKSESGPRVLTSIKACQNRNQEETKERRAHSEREKLGKGA